MDKPENMQNDNTKMYAVAKKNKYLKPPQILFIRGKDGLTTNPTEQSKIVVEYFKRLFMINNIWEPIPPTKILIPFIVDEIQKEIAKMRTNKSSECDEIPVELIRYALKIIHKRISEIYNHDTYRNNIRILNPLQKPNKAEYPPLNLKTIILLSSLRKILAACIINRIKNRLDLEISPLQAA